MEACLDKLNWYWIIAFILNDVAIFYTGYLFWSIAKRDHFYGQDSKIMHCKKCGRPEVVPYFVNEIKDCSYCSGYWCDTCNETHFPEDEGYYLKHKINTSKTKTSK